MDETLYIILTTYNRLANALATIMHVTGNMAYTGPVRWLVADDGSPDDYLSKVSAAIPKEQLLETYNGNRKGVGHNMNWAINTVKHKYNGKLMLFLEDDWALYRGFDMDQSAKLLMDHVDIGMVRFGYLSPGSQMHLFSRNNALWFDFTPNGYQYRFTGHPSLRHMRFHEEYGMYKEGIAPGATELSMCGLVNAKPGGPKIVMPTYFEQQWGVFHHIGTQSLADVEPDV